MSSDTGTLGAWGDMTHGIFVLGWVVVVVVLGPAGEGGGDTGRCDKVVVPR